MPDYYSLPVGKDAPRVVNAVIEIPRGSRQKVEYDPELGVFALDRVLSSAMVYVVDYGFLPSTLAGDGDAADVLVLVEEPSFVGCVMPVRPVGMMVMEDAGEDYKILCVPAGDKRYDDVTDLEHVASHRLREIEHFFKTYKTLDEKFPEVAGWRPLGETLAYVEKCMAAFKAAK